MNIRNALITLGLAFLLIVGYAIFNMANKVTTKVNAQKSDLTQIMESN